MKTIITLILLSFNLQARDCYNEDGGAAEKCFEALAHLELIN